MTAQTQPSALEALRDTLDLIEKARANPMSDAAHHRAVGACTTLVRDHGAAMLAALAAAPAPAEREAVAWQYRSKTIAGADWCTCEGGLNPGYNRDEWEVRPLYTHPREPVAGDAVDAKCLARDIHYALADDGLAPLAPVDSNAMRETILRVLLAARTKDTHP